MAEGWGGWVGMGLERERLGWVAAPLWRHVITMCEKITPMDLRYTAMFRNDRLRVLDKDYLTITGADELEETFSECIRNGD